MSSNPETVSATTTSATTLSQKPQIFINHVDQAVSSEMIQAACDAICGPNTSIVVLKQSHDNNYKNCLITLTSDDNVKKLHETKQLKIGETLLRLDPYQAQYPNLFMRNTDNLTQEQIEEGMKQIVKGIFHVYYGTLQVSFFIENESELNKLISQPQKIADKICSFQKYIDHSIKQEKNCLLIRYPIGQPLNLTLEESLKKEFGQIKLFSLDQNQQQQLMVASVTFENTIDAEKLFNHITSNQNTLYNIGVTVQWKKSREDSIDQKLFLKNLKPSSNEKQIIEALSVLGGEVVSVECQVSRNNDVKTYYNALVQMGSAKQCEDLMIKAHSNKNIKQLFEGNLPYIAPYISPPELTNLKKQANQQNNQNQGRTPQMGQDYSPFLNSQQLPQQQQFQMPYLPFNQGMNNQYMNPFLGQNEAIQGQQPGFNNRRQQPQNTTFLFLQQQFGPQQQFINQQHNQPYQQQQQQKQQPAQNQDKNQQKFRQNQFDRHPRAQHKNNSQKNNNQYQQQKQQPKQQQQSNQQQQHVAANNSLPYLKMNETQMVELLKTDTKAFEDTVIPSLQDIVKKELSASFASNVHQIGEIVEMLIDLEIFTKEQIIQLIYNKTELNDRIKEAIALLNGAN